MGRTWGSKRFSSLSNQRAESGGARTAPGSDDAHHRWRQVVQTESWTEIEAQGQDRGPCHPSHFGGTPQPKMSLLPLPGSLWSLGSGLGSWCQEISGCLSRLQHGQPSGSQRRHCQLTTKAAESSGRESLFTIKALFSRTLGEKRPFAELSLPKAFTTCLTADEPEGSLARVRIPVSPCG